MAMCDVEAMSEAQARLVGVLAGKSSHDDIVDVAVVEGALRRGDAIVTADRDHIEKVKRATRKNVLIEDV
jgi:hypothetical protein